MSKEGINIVNRRARFEYELIDEYTAGIKLQGTEIKSIRNGKASLGEAYGMFILDELWIRDMHIAEYKYGSYANHEPKRPRKLLLNRHELKKIQKRLAEKGLTVVPTRLFIDDNGRAKLGIAVGRGKKKFDKRESIKRREDNRKMDRAMKR
ncbi:MAG: SsrA-binding protein SmpB [Flavobacteriales bacterium]|nr:SsrA-binding protein SmpB [Flavobacteriales bacterium]